MSRFGRLTTRLTSTGLTPDGSIRGKFPAESPPRNPLKSAGYTRPAPILGKRVLTVREVDPVPVLPPKLGCPGWVEER